MNNHNRMEDALFDSNFKLSEREKELHFFYSFIKLVSSENAVPEKIYQGLVDLIPPAWQYPEITCAKLVIDDHEFSTKNFTESKWQQKGDISIKGTKIGFLIVGYTSKRSEADEGPFLKEERLLLDTICELVVQATQRKQMEVALYESEAKYRTLVDEVNDGIYICDLNGSFTYINRAMTCMLGFEHPADIIGRRFKEFLPPEKGYELAELYRKAMSSGTNSTLISTEIIRQDGTSVFAEIKPAFFIRDGELIHNQGVVRDITKRNQADIRLKYLSMHDSLTGLYNRRFFDEEMSRLKKGRQFPTCIVMADVDKLKIVNDTESHKVGDKLLQRVAEVLKKSFRDDDIIARIGGDEFAVLLPNADENIARKTMKRIQKNLQENNKNENGPACILSTGVYTAKNAIEFDTALIQADEAMYLEKKNKTNPERQINNFEET